MASKAAKRQENGKTIIKIFKGIIYRKKKKNKKIIKQMKICLNKFRKVNLKIRDKISTKVKKHKNRQD